LDDPKNYQKYASRYVLAKSFFAVISAITSLGFMRPWPHLLSR
jgi:hypothetical protein